MAGGASLLDSLPGDGRAGADIYALAARLYPINRSLTGNGVRRTLELLGAFVPLAVHEVPSGTAVLDWTVPPEWRVGEAYIADMSGRRIVDVARHSLHLVGYSTPVRRRMTRAELSGHLHTLPERPDAIPYRTSYYRKTWGFCLAHRDLEAMGEGPFEVVVDTALDPSGSLTYGEMLVPGETDAEVLLSAHICHPSLANDNCSGLALLAWLGLHLAQRRRRFSYRLLFAPGTIGAITWLARNRETVGRIGHGLVVANVGDGGGPVYKRSRRGDALVDRAAAHVLRQAGPTARVDDFSPYGYDERQYGSPGFDLPVGSFQRSRWGEFDAYHTSADDLSLIRPEHLDRSVRLVAEVLDVLEGEATFVATQPFGEPQLGRRGLYDGADGRPLPESVRMALLWVLNQSDGGRSLLSIAERSGLTFGAIRTAADAALAAGLLRAA